MRNKMTKRLVAGFMTSALVLSSAVYTPTVASAATKTVTVKNQKQLNAALKDSKVTQVVIKTSASSKLTVKDADYSKKSLVVSAPKSTVTTAGDFKKIEIKDAKTVTDKGDGNSIVIKDPNSLKFTASTASSDTSINVASKNGKISIVNNGSVGDIKITGKSTVNLSGSSSEAPNIVSNVAGAKITTSQDANIYLNKSASLTVKGSASVGQLVTKADSKISISEKASIQDMQVNGSSAKIAMKVNGTIGNLVADKMKSLTITGSPKSAVPITNNAKSAKIESYVPSELTLNADTNIKLGKGAEGSDIVTTDKKVKTTVENNTSGKIPMTDASGKESIFNPGDKGSASSSTSTSGSGSSSNSSSSSSSSNNGSYIPPVNPPANSGGQGNKPAAVTITPTITIKSGAKSIIPGETLVASATNSASDKDAVYTFTWKIGDTVRFVGDTYKVTEVDCGEVLTLVATATINDVEYTGKVDSSVVKIYVNSIDDKFTQICVPTETSVADITAKMPSKVKVYGVNNKSASVNVTWKAPDGFDNKVMDVYSFEGTVTLPDGWMWAGDKPITLHHEVLVMGNKIVHYTVGYPSTIGGLSESEALAANQPKVTLSHESESYNFNFVLHGNYLKMAKFDLLGMGEHNWVGLTVSLDESLVVKDNLYLGTSINDMRLLTGKNEGVTLTSRDNMFLLWAPADVLSERDFNFYMKYGENGNLTPLTISFENNIITLESLKSEIPESVEDKFPNPTFLDKLPKELTFVDAEEDDALVPVQWTCSDNWGLSDGEYTFTATPARRIPAVFSKNLQLPTVKVKLAKGDYEEAPEAPTVTKTTAHTISIEPMENCEFAVVSGGATIKDDTVWQTAAKFENLTPSTAYSVYARYIGTGIMNASDPSAAASATTKEDVIKFVKHGFEDNTLDLYVGDEATTISNLELPSKVRFFAEGDMVGTELDVTWAFAKEVTGDVLKEGTYTVNCSVKDDYTDIYDFTGLKMPSIKITVHPEADRPTDVVKAKLTVNAERAASGSFCSEDTALTQNKEVYDISGAESYILSGSVNYVNDCGLFADNDAAKAGYFVPVSFAVPTGTTADDIVITNGTGYFEVGDVTEGVANGLLRVLSNANECNFKMAIGESAAVPYYFKLSGANFIGEPIDGSAFVSDVAGVPGITNIEGRDNYVAYNDAYLASHNNLTVTLDKETDTLRVSGTLRSENWDDTPMVDLFLNYPSANVTGISIKYGDDAALVFDGTKDQLKDLHYADSSATYAVLRCKLSSGQENGSWVKSDNYKVRVDLSKQNPDGSDYIFTTRSLTLDLSGLTITESDM